jgi:hypothetical protein
MYQSQCMAQNSWWWAERLPETCRVIIPIKLEFSASVGFIHFNCYDAQLCEHKMQHLPKWNMCMGQQNNIKHCR